MEIEEYCERCDQQSMTHVSKDGTLVYCVICWVPKPIPLDLLPLSAKLREVKRLKTLAEEKRSTVVMIIRLRHRELTTLKPTGLERLKGFSAKMKAQDEKTGHKRDKDSHSMVVEGYSSPQDVVFPGDPRVEISEVNLITSHVAGQPGMHAACLDIDSIPVRLTPSRTPGNFHLFIDKPMPWETYKNLLYVLGEAGILEWGYVNASIAKGCSALRLSQDELLAEARKNFERIMND